MPELPEVQTIANDLNKKIKDYEIVDFWSDWKKSIKMPLVKFKKEIIGGRIKKVERKGKNILVYLDRSNIKKGRDAINHVCTEKIMLVHLKMTGHLLIKNPNYKLQITNKLKTQNIKYKNKKEEYFNDKVNQYIRHIWFLKKGRKNLNLEFSDLRKFAKIKLLNKKEFENDKELNSLGVEPLSREFTVEKLKEILAKKKKTAIKIVLMDQNLIAGIGNIYANEALFESNISPKRLAGKVKKEEVEKLYKNIVSILTKAIKMRGTSDSDYRDTDGAPGGFQNFLKVYNREGEKCPKCGCAIKREKIGQRSAYYCEKCQK